MFVQMKRKECVVEFSFIDLQVKLESGKKTRSNTYLNKFRKLCMTRCSHRQLWGKQRVVGGYISFMLVSQRR